MPDTDMHEAESAKLRTVLLAARDAGFLGPGPVERHLLHAKGFVELARVQPETPARPRVLDLGSGGGLPGLVLAQQWPVAQLVLLDANERRTQFLQRAVATCGLGGRVEVVLERAEIFGRDESYRHTFDGVVVRSFGPPAVVAECAAPLLKVGGWVIVSEPPVDKEGTGSPVPEEQDEAGRWPAEQLTQFGMEPEGFVRNQFGYQVLRQSTLCPDRFPRRNGMPAKRPLF